MHKYFMWDKNSVKFTFQDLLNFDDPLNVEAAEHYERDKVSFKDWNIDFNPRAYHRPSQNLSIIDEKNWFKVKTLFIPT